VLFEFHDRLRAAARLALGRFAVPTAGAIEADQQVIAG
jgi:hypothetical protein